jgi:putative ABC transport system permease protein
MLKLAWKNLTYERTRLVISVGGIALAVLLIFVMQGVFAGSEEHAVAYIRNQPALLWIMQAGVENLHMSTSLMPPGINAAVRAVDGVQEAIGILYVNAGIDLGEELVYSYIFGIDPGIPLGSPWKMAEGTKDLGSDEIIIDVALAKRYGLSLGDPVSVLGGELVIAGLSQETFGIATSISFVNKSALAHVMGVSPQSASYILVQPKPGADLGELEARLIKEIPDISLLIQDTFIASDKLLIRQMGADIIKAISIVAYIVGLLVIGLTIYTATLERMREYGVLKAVGAGTFDLALVVFSQAFASTSLGYVLGIGLAQGVAGVVVRLFPEMLIVLEPARLIGQFPLIVLITAAASLMPLGRVLRVDPMIVFRT